MQEKDSIISVFEHGEDGLEKAILRGHHLSSVTILIDVSLTGKATALISISRRGSAISPAKEGKSGCIYNLVKS